MVGDVAELLLEVLALRHVLHLHDAIGSDTAFIWDRRDAELQPDEPVVGKKRPLLHGEALDLPLKQPLAQSLVDLGVLGEAEPRKPELISSSAV